MSVAQVVDVASSRTGLALIETAHDGLLVAWGRGEPIVDPSDWRPALRGLLRPGGGAWSGGAVGWIGYEAGAVLDRQPVHARCGLPTVALWRWEAGLLHRPGGDWRPVGTPAGRAEAAALLASASSRSCRKRLRPVGSPPPPRSHQGPAYRAAVQAALEHIATGDVYQVCLAWEQVLDGTVDPVAAWHALRQDNPAERAALLRVGDQWLLSNSPETFLDVAATPDGLHVRSVPIKGTVPVSAGPEGRAWLDQSPKERAELTMIVDLVRNDLGRVASPGTVQTGPRILRRCGDLIHAEQEVEARLRPGVDAVDAMAAAFPPGSVTGAPKVRAMELIHALERAPRGPYTGTLGVWGDDGSVNSSVLIRTASIEPNRSRYHIGAGIVADSVPDREWEETCQKGEALGAALAQALGS